MTLIDKYIDYISAQRRYSPRTAAIYADVLHRFASFSCAEDTDEALIASLTHTGIRNYEVHILEGTEGMQPLSARTVNMHLSVLSGFCRYLGRLGLLKGNPVRLMKRPKQAKRLPQVYRQDAVRTYLDSTSQDGGSENMDLISGDDRVSENFYNKRLSRLIIMLLADTGMRRAELIGLTVSSVDFARNVIRVRGKGDKMREIPILPTLSEEISLYLLSVATVTGCERLPSDPLLVTFRGRALYPVFVDRAVKRELSSADGITGKKSPHVLRHTLATGLLDDGADLYSIKEVLGHSSLAATQVYTHNSVEKLKSVYINAHPRAKKGGSNGD